VAYARINADVRWENLSARLIIQGGLDMLNLLKKRRSIRRYKQTPLKPEEMQCLVKAALLSPSSRGRQPWEFIMVTDPIVLEKLSVSKPHSAAFLKSAALGVVIVADPGISDVWVEDTSIAATLVHLTAASMDLGSCWIQIRGREHCPGEKAGDYIKNLLEIPEKYEVEAIIAVGYPDEKKAPRSEGDLPYKKAHLEKFGTPWPK